MPPKHSIQNIESAIKRFLETETKRPIKDKTIDLVASGIISSFIMFQLIEFIEKKFKVKVDILSLNPDNFNSLQSISEQIKLWMSK